MDASKAKQPIDQDMTSRPSKPFNLTAVAEPMSWVDACQMVGVSGHSNEIALDIRGLTKAENGLQNDGAREAVYIVVAGFGVLQCGDVDLECTGGDVLFVPRGCPHRFEQLDGEIRIWSISPISL